MAKHQRHSLVTTGTRYAIHLALFLGIVFALSSVAVNTTHASPVVGFNAGRIIDDGVFTNSSSMSVSQIQAFLNSKVATCDTNGTQIASEYGSNLTHAQYAATRGWSAPPYTCLKDYVDNGIGSAQLIYNIAQQYQINPQVFIVLLQKEQGLVTDTWPLASQYKTATGYACGDTSACESQYFGLTNQLKWSAIMFRSIMNNAPGWYTPYILGNNYVKWHPDFFNSTTGLWEDRCSGTTVNIQNQATRALYNYTPYQPNQAALNAGYGTGDGCSAYGNRNFYLYFTDWFGSTYFTPVTKCDSRVAGVVCVWSVRKSDGSQFLTSSETELSSAMYSYGWIDEGIDFYASSTQKSGTVPIHRLLNNNRHYYTADQSEYTSLLSAGGWIDEGVPFYVYPSTTSTNVSHGIYRLYDSTLNQHYWTLDENMKTYLINIGYSLEPSPFGTFSGLVDLPVPAAGRINIYGLKEYSGYFYTTSLSELESVVKSGYPYNGVLTTASEVNTGTAIYRLQSAGRHFYTASASERDIAVSKYRYTSEGIGFYIDDSSAQIHRLANAKNGSYLYTSNIDEVMSFTNTNGWTYEGTLVDKNSDPSPVYRFLNLLNNRHFYTIDINEATRIANKGWKYETVAFSANKSSGLPVYRLLSYDKHFYTTNASERDIAVSRYGYQYEGIAFYVSQTTTSQPAYRLQGGSDEYFYTASSSERDTAVSRYGYQYEGEGFYLPPSN